MRERECTCRAGADVFGRCRHGKVIGPTHGNPSTESETIIPPDNRELISTEDNDVDETLREVEPQCEDTSQHAETVPESGNGVSECEREWPWGDVITALEGDVMILDRIERQHPEIELRPTITNIHLAIQGLMDLVTTPQSESDPNLTKPPPLVRDTPLPDDGVLRDVGNVVERLERAQHLLGAAHRVTAFLNPEYVDDRVEQALNDVTTALTAIHDLQAENAEVKSVAQDMGEDGLRLSDEVDRLQAEMRRLNAALDRYGHHENHPPEECPSIGTEDDVDCTCGFSQALTGEQK